MVLVSLHHNVVFVGKEEAVKLNQGRRQANEKNNTFTGRSGNVGTRWGNWLCPESGNRR